MKRITRIIISFCLMLLLTEALGQVPGATATDIYEFETDYDDGRIQYEGKIIYNGMEYEFEIDGYSGAIRNWEAERFGR